jgi:predicted HTH domain antitoxin
MVEIDIEEFESFYKERLDDQFAKQKKAVSKLVGDIRDGLVEIKVSMDHFIEAGEGKIEEKALRSLHFFSDRIRKEIDEIEVPEEDLTAELITQLLNSIKKLFTNINEIARKSLPKFQKEVQAEIKELNYITRKLGKKQATLEAFLRKKYGNVRDAEYLLDKLPKLFSLRDNIEHAKKDLDQF